MSRRSYDQFCPVAAALDLVGERWSLLIIRELLLGPQRFSDLHVALPGLGVSLLAQRLKQLSAAEIVTQQRQPAGGTAYQLTEIGGGLGPAVAALARWGLRLLASQSPPEGALRVELLALYLAASAPAVTGPREVYELRVGDSAAYVRVIDGALRAYRGTPPERPDVVAEMDEAALVDLCLGRAGLADLAAAGRARLAGERPSVTRAAQLLDRTTSDPT